MHKNLFFIRPTIPIINRQLFLFHSGILLYIIKFPPLLYLKGTAICIQLAVASDLSSFSHPLAPTVFHLTKILCDASYDTLFIISSVSDPIQFSSF